MDDITSVVSPNIAIPAATDSTVNSLVVEWTQTNPDAAKTASYRLFRQPVGATSQTEACGAGVYTDLQQSDLDAVRYKGENAQPLNLTVDVCSAAAPLAKGRYVEHLWAGNVGDGLKKGSHGILRRRTSRNGRPDCRHGFQACSARFTA